MGARIGGAEVDARCAVVHNRLASAHRGRILLRTASSWPILVSASIVAGVTRDSIRMLQPSFELTVKRGSESAAWMFMW